MELTQENFLFLCGVAVDAAEEAGQLIRDYALRDVEVKEKTEGAGDSRASQVVTEVDLLSQEIILNHLLPTCRQYDLGMLAEESNDDGSRFQKDYFWCVDPMDGTLCFTERRPGYAVSIALVSRTGDPVIGVVYDPYTEMLYYAIKGAGVFRNKEEWVWPSPQVNKPYRTITSGGAVMNVCWILEDGRDTLYYLKKPRLKTGGGCLWDYAATACIFAALGAHVSDASGDPLDLNQRGSLFMNLKGVLYAADHEIATRLLTS